MTGGTKARVLIVEDEWIVAEDHASVLRDAGYDVVGPVSMVEASLKLIDGEHVDAAILDIGLSADNSYPVAARLQELGVPFVFVSGYLAENLPDELSHQSVLSKPAVPEEMIAAVRRLLAETDSASS